MDSTRAFHLMPEMLTRYGQIHDRTALAKHSKIERKWQN
jgi:hypothetical protein